MSRSSWQTFKDRKVVQWTFAYAAVVWLTLQIASLLAETYDWPSSVMPKGEEDIIRFGAPVRVEYQVAE